jgi:hypothetical protein
MVFAESLGFSAEFRSTEEQIVGEKLSLSSIDHWLQHSNGKIFGRLSTRQ